MKLVKSVARRMKTVVLDADGTVNEMRSRALAIHTTEELFVENRIEQVFEELKADMRQKEDECDQRIKKREEELDLLLEKILEELEADKAATHAKLKRLRAASNSIAHNRCKFDPEAFKKAVVQPYNCEHRRTRFWGDEYGNGQRCLECGKEISQLFKEENQVKGWGSATDPQLNAAVLRHRENEDGFRFSSNAEITAVLDERRRLEKERRELVESEQYFYDFDGIRAMYEFDRRHRSEIKEQGIFRQGLQWREDDLMLLEHENVRKEKERLRREGMLIEQNMVGFDPLHTIDDPPPTYRALEVKTHTHKPTP